MNQQFTVTLWVNISKVGCIFIKTKLNFFFKFFLKQIGETLLELLLIIAMIKIPNNQEFLLYLNIIMI